MTQVAVKLTKRQIISAPLPPQDGHEAPIFKSDVCQNFHLIQ